MRCQQYWVILSVPAPEAAIADALQNRNSQKFRQIHSKTPELESIFLIKLQLYLEPSETSKLKLFAKIVNAKSRLLF